MSLITRIDKNIQNSYRTLLTEAEIISVHKDVVNLRNSLGNISLVSERIPFAPRQMRCQEIPSIPSIDIIQKLIKESSPTPFSCTFCLPEGKLNEKIIEQSWSVLQGISQRLPQDIFIQHLYKKLWRSIDELLTLMANGCSLFQLKEAIKNLIGLGVGLTPSGDDFLAGLLISLRLPDSPFRHWLKAIQTELVTLLSHTHSISAAFITDASMGEVNQLVQQFINVLYSKIDNQISTISNLASLGHSSGYDILSGLLAGLPHLSTRRTLLCPYIAN